MVKNKVKKFFDELLFMEVDINVHNIPKYLRERVIIEEVILEGGKFRVAKAEWRSRNVEIPHLRVVGSKHNGEMLKVRRKHLSF